MLKRGALHLLGISGLAILLSTSAMAQEGSSSNKATAQASQSDDKPNLQREKDHPSAAYQLRFTLSEIEDNKTINTRQYALNVSTYQQPGEIKDGTRVPVEIKQGEFQYLDVGTRISARLFEDKWGQTGVVVNVEMSSFALDDQDKRDTHPLIRQVSIAAITLLQSNKPLLMGSADDPNSKRRFQLEMTATKLM
ncbi:MAG TPA: hypothetical protein VGG14_16025 [Candidatus Sulfotelmatobacter sp.]|jgi:hypothetical protein